MTRREFPKAIKVAAFDRAKGRCEECTARLVPGKFEYDHDLPDGLGGEPTLENCVVRCTSCHNPKTAKHDIPMIAKAKRSRAKHLGAAKPKRAWGGKYRKKVSGEVVLREPEPDPIEEYDLYHGGLSQRKEIVE